MYLNTDWSLTFSFTDDDDNEEEEEEEEEEKEEEEKEEEKEEEEDEEEENEEEEEEEEEGNEDLGSFNLSDFVDKEDDGVRETGEQENTVKELDFSFVVNKNKQEEQEEEEEDPEEFERKATHLQKVFNSLPLVLIKRILRLTEGNIETASQKLQESQDKENATDRKSGQGGRVGNRDADKIGIRRAHSTSSVVEKGPTDQSQFERNKILIRGLSEKTCPDGLVNFIEARSGGKEVKDVQMLKNGKALVTMADEIKGTYLSIKPRE